MKIIITTMVTAVALMIASHAGSQLEGSKAEQIKKVETSLKIKAMKGKMTHFAIYAEDVERASAFYNNVFNWSLQAYGPPGFKQITIQENGEQKVIGALQSLNYSPVPERITGFECSIAVDNIDGAARAIEQAGGKIVMKKTEIPHVGWLIKFKDPEGNLACAIQYHEL
jgi:uncharacterized protein